MHYHNTIIISKHLCISFLFLTIYETHTRTRTIWFLHNWKNKNVFNAKVFNYHSIRWRWWGRLSFTGVNSLYLIITRRLFHHLLLPLTGIAMSLISLFLLMILYLLSQMLVAVGLSRRRLFTAPPPVGSGASLASSMLLSHQDVDSGYLFISRSSESENMENY